MFDQVRTTAYSRKPQVAEGKGVLIYVRVDITYDQTVSWVGGGLERSLPSGPGPAGGTDSGQVMGQSLLHRALGYQPGSVDQDAASPSPAHPGPPHWGCSEGLPACVSST